MLKSMLIGGTSHGDLPMESPLEAMLERTDRHLDNFATLVRPAPESRPRTSFTSKLPRRQISAFNFTLRQRLRVVPKAVPLLFNILRSARMYDGRFKATRSEAGPEFIAELEAMARAAGARDIRYVEVPRTAIFRDKGIPHQYAVVFTVEMEQKPIETAPSFECMLEVMRGYKNLASISNRLARFMRTRGFAAYPGTALGGLTDYPHIAELAGLGAIGYHGLLISPHEGARLRINTIYTNITNLPLHAGDEHEWVRDFCAMCKRCIRKCPPKAIYPEPRPRGDGGMQCIDHDTCRDYFSSNFGCAVCLAECPFSHVGYDKVKASFKGNKAAPRFHLRTIA